MRFYWLWFHSTILKNTSGRRKIDQTLVCTIATAGPYTIALRLVSSQMAESRVVHIAASVCQIAHLRFTFVIHHELVSAVRQKYSATAAVSSS